jgi:hypothetical protein
MLDPLDDDDDDEDPGTDNIDPETLGNDAIPDEAGVDPSIAPDDDDDDDEPDTFTPSADGEDLV